MSTTIKLRSPYYVKTTPTTNTSYVAIGLKMWQGNITSAPATYTYNLTKFVVDNQDFVIFEISNLGRDYLKLTYDGTLSADSALFLRYDYTCYDSTGTSLFSFGEVLPCADGYTEFKDGMNYRPTNEHLLQSNLCMQVPVNAKTCIAVNGANTNSVKFYEQGAIVNNVGVSWLNNTQTLNQHICYEVDQDDYYTRVENITNGNVVRNICVDSFYGSIDYGAVDKIVVEENDPAFSSTIQVQRLSECKYPIHKITFVNKFGVMQDLYMFKNSKEKMRVTDKTFKRNLLTESTFNYDTTEHQKRTILKQGNKEIRLNSGYIGECLVVAFEELFLSEQVWLTDNASNIYPVYLKDKNLDYKTSLNDKLINYTINFEYAFDAINNIR